MSTETEPKRIENEDDVQIDADTVHLSKSAARSINARDVHVDESAVLVLEANAAAISNCAIGHVVAEEATIVGSPVFLLAAERASVKESPVLLLIGTVEGDDVQPTLDWRGAAAFGFALAIGLALIGGLLNRLTRRN